MREIIMVLYAGYLKKNKQQKSRINRVFDKLRNNYLSNI